jgi:DNA-binding response OmpR family regulator
MSRILLIEDEQELSQVIREWLEDEHYIVEQSFDGKEALSRLTSSNFDLVILDLNLPSMSGLEICRTFRKAGGLIPILILTAKRALSAKECGLDSGADDYLTKPFKLRELSARVRALLRRPINLASTILTVGNVTLDQTARTVYKAGLPLHLLPKEFALLEAMMRKPGQVLSVESLTEHIWTEDRKVTPETIRSHLRSLRKKLTDRDGDCCIHNVYGFGYKIES